MIRKLRAQGSVRGLRAQTAAAHSKSADAHSKSTAHNKSAVAQNKSAAQSKSAGLTKKLHNRIRDDSGSAIVEFVTLAIPLFIPIFIYLNNFASVSGNEEIVRVLAREGLRAYAVSDSDHTGRATSAQALTVIAHHLGLTKAEIQSLSARYDCSNKPCLSANGRIRLTVSYVDAQSHRTIEASAQEHISPWK